MAVRNGVNKAVYYAWVNLKCRCDTPSCNRFYTHGARGISYDPSWAFYDNFARDMEPSWREGLTLDRIDNEGNYCKDNCRWATYAEQNQNSRNCKLTKAQAEEIAIYYHHGVDKHLLAKEFGVSERTIRNIGKGRSWV